MVNKIFGSHLDRDRQLYFVLHVNTAVHMAVNEIVDIAALLRLNF